MHSQEDEDGEPLSSSATDTHADTHADAPDNTSDDSTNDSTRATELTKAALSEEDKRLLLHVARQTLETYLDTGKRPRFEYDSPALQQLRAVFVTLWRRDTDELRGCRGESIARRPIVQAVSTMTIASAADDPRFFPVTLEETPLLRIEINALTPLAPIRPEDVEVGRHGLMMVLGQQAGLLLPEVPVRFGWNREQFLEGTCQKAGFARDAWQDPDVKLFGFESEEWGED